MTKTDEVRELLHNMNQFVSDPLKSDQASILIIVQSQEKLLSRAIVLVTWYHNRMLEDGHVDPMSSKAVDLLTDYEKQRDDYKR